MTSTSPSKGSGAVKMVVAVLAAMVVLGGIAGGLAWWLNRREETGKVEQAEARAAEHERQLDEEDSLNRREETGEVEQAEARAAEHERQLDEEDAAVRAAMLVSTADLAAASSAEPIERLKRDEMIVEVMRASAGPKPYAIGGTRLTERELGGALETWSREVFRSGEDKRPDLRVTFRAFGNANWRDVFRGMLLSHHVGVTTPRFMVLTDVASQTEGRITCQVPRANSEPPLDEEPPVRSTVVDLRHDDGARVRLRLMARKPGRMAVVSRYGGKDRFETVDAPGVLEDRIRKMRKVLADTEWSVGVVIHAEQTTPWQHIVTILNVCAKLDLSENVMFAAPRSLESGVPRPYRPVIIKPQKPREVTRPIQRREVDRPDIKQKNLPSLAPRPVPAEPKLLVLLPTPQPVPPPDVRVEVGSDRFRGEMAGYSAWRTNVVAVWLIDESRSIKNDQTLVAEKMDELYKALGDDRTHAEGAAHVVSALCSFGEKFHVVLGEPTADADGVRKALGEVPVDTSGKENVLTGINGVLDRFVPYGREHKRNLVIILVTDEAGDDDVKHNLEKTLARMKQVKASLLAWGPEAGAFNYPRELTYDPTVPKGTNPYAYVTRGIDTAFGEMIPHDWYFRRTGRVPSGFGPYGLSRLCRQTGGVYYLLRGAGAVTYDYKKLLNGYAPELASRTDVAKRNMRNKLRRTLIEIIIGWEKIRGEPGNSRFNSYYQNTEAGKQRMQQSIKVVDEWLALTNRGIAELERLGNITVKDSPKRWAANRDLMWAELHKLRFQLTQYKLALGDLMVRKNVPPSGDRGWHISWHRNPILRGDDMNATLAERKRIEAMFQTVIDKHAGTPWEVFARREMRQMRGFAIHPSSRRTLKPFKREMR